MAFSFLGAAQNRQIILDWPLRRRISEAIPNRTARREGIIGESNPK
jgi:hypothetical protein